MSDRDETRALVERTAVFEEAMAALAALGLYTPPQPTEETS